MIIKKILSACLAAVLLSVLVAGCAQSSDNASENAEASASASVSPAASDDAASAEETAKETASAEAESSSSADDSAAVSGDGLPWFFEEWPKKLEALNATDMTEQLEVSASLSAMVEECRNWQAHQSGDIVTIDLPSDAVVVTAQGSDTALQNASIECVMTNLEDGVSPSLILFTVGAGALVEVMSGVDDGGLETVNDAVAALLSASSDQGVLTADPIAVGNASFQVSLDTATKTLKLSGSPA